MKTLKQFRAERKLQAKEQTMQLVSDHWKIWHGHRRLADGRLVHREFNILAMVNDLALHDFCDQEGEQAARVVRR